MNDEIKKAQYEINILSNTILDETTYKPTIERRKVLYNYITNLQQENDMLKQGVKDTYDTSQEMLAEKQQEIERLKDSIDWWKDRFFGQQEYDDSHRITAIEYKKRIDKAIEYIENNKEKQYGYNYEYELTDKNIDELLNILQNGSDDNE